MMPPKLRPPKIPSSISEGNMGLAVKDGLREVRFNVKRGARKLVKGVQTAIHPEGGELSGPLGLLSPPVDLAIRTTVQLLRTADHAAVDLLSSDGRYRNMDVPLCPSSAYFSAEHAVDPIRPFTRDHGWRYRHLLALRGEDTMFVHEQRIERVGQQLRSALSLTFEDTPDLPQLLNARIVMALETAEVLTPAIDAEPELPEEANAFSNHLALSVVLAGEIAPRLPGPVNQQTAMALRLADEICAANREPLTRAMANPKPEVSLAAWMAFALRHI
jgi:hypothetical protein